jgi:hypothetical protein
MVVLSVVCLHIPQGATAQEASDTKFTVKAKVSPNKAGTKRHPRGVRLRVTARWDAPAGVERPIISRAVALFPRGSLYNGAKYPRCSKRLLDRKGPSACPKRSIMGRARGVAWADTVDAKPRVVLVNGGARRVWLYTTLYHPTLVKEAIPVIVQKRRGKWAYRARIVVPKSLLIVAGVPIGLERFTLTAGRGDWLATTGCPRNRRWPFKVTTYYMAGGSSTFTSSVRCRR